MALSISEECGNILATPDEATAYTADIWGYLIDFILDDIAQLGPFYAAIARQRLCTLEIYLR